MKRLFTISLFLSVFLISCNKKNVDFTLNSLTLTSFNKDSYPIQNVYIKVKKVGAFPDITLDTTDIYTTQYTLPAEFGVDPGLKMNFYKNNYVVELWGDSSGFIGKNTINIKDYKIHFPLEMATTNSDGLEISLHGTWK